LETVVSFDVTASVAFAHADASSTRSLLATLLLGLAAVGASLLQTRPASFDELQVLLRCHCRLLLLLFVAGFLLESACVLGAWCLRCVCCFVLLLLFARFFASSLPSTLFVVAGKGTVCSPCVERGWQGTRAEGWGRAMFFFLFLLCVFFFDTVFEEGTKKLLGT